MNCFTPREIYVPGSGTADGKYIDVPCGKCLVCLQNKRNDWSFRLMEEYKRSKSAAFITLTYAPKYLPSCGVVKRHFQLFMKRLRKKSGARLRYYAVGEYGSKTGRPHYHAIIFNYEGSIQFLSTIWPFGECHIGKVTEASCAYVTKYVIQKPVMGNGELNDSFALMSRAYGLGLGYLTDEMASWHRLGGRNYILRYGQKIRLPRYYKDKIWPLLQRSKTHTLSGLAILERWRTERESIGLSSFAESERSRIKNEEDLRSQGYDPIKIQAEMRAAVVSRIQSKITYTQTF